MKNTFIWADLSTFDIQSAKHFYSQCFGWGFQDIDADYTLCQAHQCPTAGLYTMPEEFQSIGMPSFWMSYIQVDRLDEIVVLAEQHGAKIEIKPQPAPGGGVIALIRDPAGAGFTCYEGEGLGSTDEDGHLGRVVWNELHVSDLETVESFYTSVFGWRIQATGVPNRYDIFPSTDDTEPMAGIQVTNNDIKGDKEYWGVYFSVDNFANAETNINQSGGQVVAEQALGTRPALLAYDPQGAAFYIVEGKHNPQIEGSETDKYAHKWRAVLGLVIVAIAVLTEANWVWGLLFLFWIVPDIQRGSTHFMEYVERRKNPVVYWLIIATWLALSIYLLVVSLGA